MKKGKLQLANKISFKLNYIFHIIKQNNTNIRLKYACFKRLVVTFLICVGTDLARALKDNPLI